VIAFNGEGRPEMERCECGNIVCLDCTGVCQCGDQFIECPCEKVDENGEFCSPPTRAQCDRCQEWFDSTCDCGVKCVDCRLWWCRRCSTQIGSKWRCHHCQVN
jgi:hypothetical protein